MLDILQLIPGRKKLTQSGWHSFNAVCCHHRGHKTDRRGRGGLRKENENWTYHCFNCNFKCSFVLGKPLSRNTRQFLTYCSVDKDQIEKLNLESLKHKDLVDYITVKKIKKKIAFKEAKLPDDSELIDVNNIKHKKYVDYLLSRKIKIEDYPFLCTVNGMARNANRIIIPYTYNNKIVGYTSRYLDNKIPKYINEQQPGYVFGMDLQKPEYEVCIITEGIFDALSINGCALLHNDINEQQVDTLKSLSTNYITKKFIFVPDQDKSGLSLCEKMLDLGFFVSIPDWEIGIKDVNDSVVKYGKLPTLLSILQSATNSKIKVELQRKKHDKRL